MDSQYHHDLPEHAPSAQQQQQQQQHQYPSPSFPSAWQPFSVPTKTDLISSGFPYDTRLHDLRVTREQWFQFTSALVQAAKIPLKDDLGAWTAGITTGTVGTGLLLVLGPVAGYRVGKAVHKKTVLKRVKERLVEDGEIQGIMRRWNEGAWKEKGFHTWIEFPDEGEVEEEEVVGGASKKEAKEAKKKAKAARSGFRIAVTPNDILRPQLAQTGSSTQSWSPVDTGQSSSKGGYQYQQPQGDGPQQDGTQGAAARPHKYEYQPVSPSETANGEALPMYKERKGVPQPNPGTVEIG